MKFIHAADIHLDSPLRGLDRYDGAPVERLRDATRRAFDNLVELALREQVDFVLIAGDLYDGDWRDYHTGLYFRDRVARLGRDGIRVFLVSGNHDAQSRITRSLQLPPTVTVFDADAPQTVTIESLQVAVHGQSFAREAVWQDLASGYPPPRPGWFNIGLLHTSADGREGHAPYAPCTVDGLRARGYDYWALGHVHTHEVLCEDPWIVFPGCTQGRSVRECGEKGCVLVTVDGRDVVEVRFVPVDVARWAVVSVDLAAADTAGEALALVVRALEEACRPCGGQPLAARVELVGASAAHGELVAAPERWTSEIRGRAGDAGDVWVEKVRFATRPLRSDGAQEDGDGPVGGLLWRLDALAADPVTLAALAEEEWQKLRAVVGDLAGSPDGVDAFTRTDTVPDTVVDDVRELLRARLAGRETA